MIPLTKDQLLYLNCLNQADVIISNPSLFKQWNNITDIEVLANMLYNLAIEKEINSAITDQYIEYDDEILEIEELEEMDLMDITVSGDNLFFANNILTKNSSGISHTADSMFALISTAELAQLNHVRIKQLKNRYGDVFRPNSFLVGVERSKMSFYDVDLPDNLSQPKQQIDLDDVEDDDILGKPTYTGSNELVF